MIVLGIETSCDETAVAVLEEKGGRITILSNVVASSASLQAKYGGIIPEQAAREQIKSIIPVIEEALVQSNLCLPSSIVHRPPIDALAVTQGPGLIGSLLVGVETAKVLAKVWGKPLIPVNHLIGHFYANWIDSEPKFPCIGLLVSGGHTDLVLFTSHGKYTYLGGTRDDAAGECFDKCARALGLPYPGGPEISKLASKGDSLRFNLPRPMIDSPDFDFSFSGLKTAVSRLVASADRDSADLQSKAILKIKESGQANQTLVNLAASIEEAIVDCLVEKTIRAAQIKKIEQIIVAGGVAANPKLKQELGTRCKKLGIELHIPQANLCTDNGAMIAAAAFFLKPTKEPTKLQADPNLSLAY